MKFQTIIFLFILLLISKPIFCAEPVAKINFFQGTVKVKKDTIWEEVELNMSLNAGDSLKTMEDSRVEIKFMEQGVIRLDQHSLFEISKLEKTDKNFLSKTKVLIGNIWSHVRSLSEENDVFETSSPTAVAAVRGTVFRCDVAEDTSTDVYVYEGRVEVKPWTMPKPKQPEDGKSPWGDLREVEGPTPITMEEWVVLVREMQKVSIAPDGEKPKLQDIQEKEDEENEWVQWNRARDEILFDE